MKKINTVNEYCHQLLGLGRSHNKVLVSLLLSLTSESVKSVVELSESQFFGRNYSSNYTARDTCVFQTDGMPYDKSYSEMLAGRQYIKLPNKVIASDNGLGKGYNYSYINLSDSPVALGSRWSLLLIVK